MILPRPLNDCTMSMWDREHVPLVIVAAWIELTTFTNLTVGNRLADTVGRAPGGWWAQVDAFIVGPRWLVKALADVVAVDGFEHLTLSADSEGVITRDLVLGVSYAETTNPNHQLTAGEST